MPNSGFFCRVFLLFFAICPAALAQIFIANATDSNWSAVSEAAVCSITHTIPGFGKAVLNHDQKKGDVFYLELQSKLNFPVGATRIDTLPPAWRSDLVYFSLGSVQAVAGNQPITLSSETASSLLAYLMKGIDVVFTSSLTESTGDGKASSNGNASSVENDVMRVVVQSRNFTPAYKKYLQCTGKSTNELSPTNTPSGGAKYLEVFRQDTNPKEYVQASKQSSSVTINLEANRTKYLDVFRMESYPKEYANISRPSSSVMKVANASSVRYLDVFRMESYPKEYANASRESTVTRTTHSTGAKIFETEVAKSDWKNQSGPFACLMTHSVEGFGNAIISSKANGEEVFYLNPQNEVVFPQGVASIDTLSPTWRSNVASMNLGKTTAVAGSQPIKLKREEFSPLLKQLTGGTNVMFTAQAPDDGTAKKESSAALIAMRVVVGPKNFPEAYKNYQQCISDLVPYTFEQLSHLSFNYMGAADGLSAATKAELNKVARYVKADPKVLGILVDAHSDKSGTAEVNEATSKQQSEWVSEYLVAQGVSKGKIMSRWHGDLFPIANNKTDEGRAKNRRVTVRLESDDTRREMEAKIAKRIEEEQKQLAEAKAAAEAQAAAKAAQAAQAASKALADGKSVSASHSSAVTNSSEASSTGKLTPEDIGKMLEGLDLIPEE